VNFLCGFDDGRGKVCSRRLAVGITDTRGLRESPFGGGWELVYNWVLLPCKKHDLVGIPTEELLDAELTGRQAVHFRRRFGAEFHKVLEASVREAEAIARRSDSN
jgi:hypothetical protein